MSKAVTALNSSSLFKARESLIKNFVVVLLKKLLKEASDYKEGMRISSALNAVEQIHKDIYTDTLKSKLTNLIKTLSDENLDRTFLVLQRLTDSWEYLELDVKQKLEAYVENLPKEKLDELNFLLSHTGLSPSANKRLQKTTRVEIDEPLFFDLPIPVGDRIVELFVDSESFYQANSFSSTVTRYASDFTKEQVEKVIRACGDNYEIRNSFEVGKVINAMRKNKQVTDADVDAWLIDVDLKQYTKPDMVEEDG
ncbi:hypothetical protein [Nitrosomonas ureae]|uniref:Uncharacterized protein n=1 Tax=Nitrosomonas ureae TaxID=44577 RepID=A0A1H9CNV6_9PROT|nr:hypothetical protein [Nitrosomonas ureae]SEQ02849.1 hypothetical protein SAMN05421510_10161 [Nitrosomonas ureae]